MKRKNEGDNEGKVLLITGAGRGMGMDIARSALAAGYKTVATGRNVERVMEAVGASDDLLVIKLDHQRRHDLVQES